MSRNGPLSIGESRRPLIQTGPVQVPGRRCLGWADRRVFLGAPPNLQLAVRVPQASSFPPCGPGSRGLHAALL